MRRNWPNWCQRPKPAAHTSVHCIGSAGHAARPDQQPPALGQLTEALHWAPSTTSEPTPRAISRAPLCCSWQGWPRGPPGQMEGSRSLTSRGGPLVPEDPGAVSSTLPGPSGLFDVPCERPRGSHMLSLKDNQVNLNLTVALDLTGSLQGCSQQYPYGTTIQHLKVLCKGEKGREMERKRFKDA